VASSALPEETFQQRRAESEPMAARPPVELAPRPVTGNQAFWSFERQQNLNTGDSWSVTFTDSGGLAVTGTGMNVNSAAGKPCW
jgi:hypothetical protein